MIDENRKFIRIDEKGHMDIYSLNMNKIKSLSSHNTPILFIDCLYDNKWFISSCSDELRIFYMESLTKGEIIIYKKMFEMDEIPRLIIYMACYEMNICLIGGND